MHINREGHILITPREFEAYLRGDFNVLINDIWLAGTPRAFPTYANWCRFLRYLADGLGVHPRNIVVRGSTKIGFSIAPHEDSAWMRVRPDSDLDLAIVDPDYYHYFDREFRHYERVSEGRAFRGSEAWKTFGRIKTRAYYTYRYHHFPDLQCVQNHLAVLNAAPVEPCCGLARELNAFIYRDWWALYGRCRLDLTDLSRALSRGEVAHGSHSPRVSPLLLQGNRSTGPGDSTATMNQYCDACGSMFEQLPLGWSYACPSAPVCAPRTLRNAACTSDSLPTYRGP
jgi:hypothetical protein